LLPVEYIPRYTVEDYRKWKGDWELIEGIPFAMTPSPFGKHQKITGNLVTLLNIQRENCLEKNINVYVELDWIINDNTVVRPDVSVLCREVDEYIKTTPEAIFEVVSKSTALKDEKIKFELYREEGVKFYILVYPDIKKVRAFRINNREYEKVFDDEDGIFSFNLCGCDFELNIKKVFS